MDRDAFTTYLNSYLKADEFNDLGPNGLQVEGRDQVKKIITAVSVSVELIEKALAAGADSLVVHHGLIWDFERPLYRGGYRQRVKLLLENGINLYAYHLPLDAHPEVGNNAQIAQILGLSGVQPFGEYKGQLIGWQGEVNGIGADVFLDKIKSVVNPDSLIFPYGPDTIRRVGIVSGGAQKEVRQAVIQGLDCFITGEVSEHIMHYVKEEGIHFAAAGHYATERFGVQALAGYLRDQLNIDASYLDIPNPV